MGIWHKRIHSHGRVSLLKRYSQIRTNRSQLVLIFISTATAQKDKATRDALVKQIDDQIAELHEKKRELIAGDAPARKKPRVHYKLKDTCGSP